MMPSPRFPVRQLGPHTRVMDRVRFILPTDKEMMFPAVAAMQMFVNTHAERMRLADPTGGQYSYILQYEVVGDMSLFRRIDVHLAVQPSAIDNNPDMVVDMSDNVLLKLQYVKRNCGQITGMLCGTPTHPVPLAKKVRPRTESFIWWDLDSNQLVNELLADIKDDEISGVYGRASVYTFLAATLGLPVVEVIPADRPDTWLSKFTCTGYRLIRDTGNEEQNAVFVERAKRNVEMELIARDDLQKKGAVSV